MRLSSHIPAYTLFFSFTYFIFLVSQHLNASAHCFFLQACGMHTKLHECSMAQGPSTWAVAAFFSSQEEDDFLKLFKGSDKQMDMKGSRFCLCCSHESLGTGKLSPEGAAKNVIGGSPQTIIDLALLKTNFSSTEIKLLIFYSFSNACTDHWFSPSLSSRVLVSSGGKKE